MLSAYQIALTTVILLWIGLLVWVRCHRPRFSPKESLVILGGVATLSVISFAVGAVYGMLRHLFS